MEGYSQFMVSSYSKNNDNAVRQTTGAKPPAVDLGVLHNASNILVEQHSKDAQIVPDFGDLISSCTFLHFCSPNASKLSLAVTQVSASYSVFPDDTRVPFQKRKFIGIPEGLFQFTTSK